VERACECFGADIAYSKDHLSNYLSQLPKHTILIEDIDVDNEIQDVINSVLVDNTNCYAYNPP